MGAQDQIVATEAKIASQGAQVTDKPAVPVAVEVETPDAPTDQTGDDADSSTDADQVRQRNKKPAGERISELTKNWRTEQREKQAAKDEAEYWRKQALERGQTPPATQPQPTQGSSKKTLEDFGYDQGAYIQYEIAEGIKAQRIAEEETRVKNEHLTAAQKREQAYQERVAKYQAANPDIDYEAEVQHGQIAISTPMAEYIKESDVGPEIAVYFRDNPDEAKEIYAMSERAADRHLAKLEARLTTSADTDNAIPPQPAQITRAPPVPGRVNAGSPKKKSGSIEDEIATVRELRKRRA